MWNSLPNHVVEARLNRFWTNQDVKQDFTADLCMKYVKHWFNPRGASAARIFVIIVHLFVCVTPDCIRTAKRKITQTTPRVT